MDTIQPQTSAQEVDDFGREEEEIEALQYDVGNSPDTSTLSYRMPPSAHQPSLADTPVVPLPLFSSTVCPRPLATTTTSTTTTTATITRSARSATQRTHPYYRLSPRVRTTIERRRVNPTFAKPTQLFDGAEHPGPRSPMAMSSGSPRSVVRASNLVNRLSSRSKAHDRRVTGLLDRLTSNDADPQLDSDTTDTFHSPEQIDGRLGRSTRSQNKRQETTEEMRIPFINRYHQRQAYLWKMDDGYS